MLYQGNETKEASKGGSATARGMRSITLFVSSSIFKMSADGAEKATSAQRTTAFSVRNGRGERLSALMTKPVGKETANESCVLLAHGFRDSKNGRLVAELAGELAMRGVATVRFSFAGNEDSEGIFEYANYESEAADVISVIAHCRDVLEMSVVCAAGHSKGAGAVLLAGAHAEGPRAIVNLAGRFDMVRGVRERFGDEVLARVEKDGGKEVTLKDGFRFTLTAEALKTRFELDMAVAARAIPASTRVLTIHGDKDEIIPVEDAYEFDKCIANHVLEVMPGAGHSFKGVEAQIGERISRFLG